MRIIVTTATRYESDLIESFCRYYLSFADGILLCEGVNHADNTLEIIENLKREGLNIIPYAPAVGGDSVAMAMVDAAFMEHGADIVLPVDPDEFLFQVEGQNPRAELEKIPSDAQLMLEWETYVYEREPGPEARFLPDYFSERRVREASPLYKTALSRAFYAKHRGMIKFLEGRHGFVFTATGLMAPAVTSAQLRLAHYPLRNMAQAMSKALTGRLAYIARRLPDSQGIQWVDMFERAKRQGCFSLEDMREFSLYYSLSPAQRASFELRQEPLPAAFFEKPQLKYTSFGQPHETVIKDLLVRMEEIVRSLLAQEEKKDHFINWGKIGEIGSAMLMKLRRSIDKRLASFRSKRLD